MEKLFSHQNSMAHQIYQKIQLRHMESKAARNTLDTHRLCTASGRLIARAWREAPDNHPGASDKAQIVRMPGNCLEGPIGVLTISNVI